MVSICAAGAVSLLPEMASSTTHPVTLERLRLTGPLVAWAIAGLALGAALGAIEIGAVSLAVAIGGATSDAWIIYAVLGVASMTGGLVDGLTAGRDSHDHRPRIVLLAALMMTGGLVTALATNPLLILTGVAILGLPTAPLLSARSLRTEAVAAPCDRSRAFTLVFAAQSLGFAAAGLLLAQLGHHGAIIIATTAVLTSTLIVAMIDKPNPGSLPSQQPDAMPCEPSGSASTLPRPPGSGHRNIFAALKLRPNHVEVRCPISTPQSQMR